MVVKEIFYGIKCDRCGEMQDDGEHSFWNDEITAVEYAYDSDWSELNGRHYCNNCSEIDEETDEVKVYEEYPEHLKTLNKFIDSVAKGIRRKVSETDLQFSVKCSFYNRPILEPFEENYIKQLLDDKFISLDYQQGKYKDCTCTIKFCK